MWKLTVFVVHLELLAVQKVQTVRQKSVIWKDWVHVVRLSFLLVASATALAIPTAAVAATYYVDSASGDDANTGLSPATAWKSINKVNRTSFAVGDDVMLRSGSVFENQALQVDWSGTESNWVNIDCYTVNSSNQPVACSTSHPRPQLNGTLEAHCAPNNTCLHNRAGAVPSSQYDGLVVVSSSYVSVKNLSLRDSAGTGVVFASEASNPRHHFILENVDVHTTFQALVVIGTNHSNGVVRNFHGQQYGLCELYRYAECTGPGWPPGVIVHDSKRAMILFENNLVHDGFGEGFNCLRSSHVMFKGNRAGNVTSNPFYLDNCSNSLLERNISWGDTDGKWGSANAFSSVDVTNEDYSASGSLSSINNVIRNNLFTSTGTCINAGQYAGSLARGEMVGFHFYGNTCVAMHFSNTTIDASSRPSQVLIQNNIFYSPSLKPGGSICSAPRSTEIQFKNNLWASTPDDVDCRGPGDITGDPKLNTPVANFRAMDRVKPPTPFDFSILPGSLALAKGSIVPDDDATFVSTFTQFKQQLVGDRCDVSSPGLPYDYHCSNRQELPTIGAIDKVKYPPRAPTIISSQ
jgi:hypothetical protein